LIILFFYNLLYRFRQKYIILFVRGIGQKLDHYCFVSRLFQNLNGPHRASLDVLVLMVVGEKIVKKISVEINYFII